MCVRVLLSGDLGQCWAHSTQRQPGMCLSHQLNTTSSPKVSKILSLTVSKHSEGSTILSLENIHTLAQVHTTWMSWEMSKNTEHMRKLRGRSPMISTVPCVCLCVCVRVGRNIMHHWTIQTQTVANAIRLTSGQGSLENLGYTPHAQKLHTHSHNTYTQTHTQAILSVMSGNASFSETILFTWDKPALAPIAEWSKQHITLLLRLSIYSAREYIVFIN